MPNLLIGADLNGKVVRVGSMSDAEQLTCYPFHLCQVVFAALSNTLLITSEYPLGTAQICQHPPARVSRKRKIISSSSVGARLSHLGGQVISGFY